MVLYRLGLDGIWKCFWCFSLNRSPSEPNDINNDLYRSVVVIRALSYASSLVLTYLLRYKWVYSQGKTTKLFLFTGDWGFSKK